MNTEDFLAHHGVRGMKWGVRRAAKKAEKADQKWEKKATSSNTYVKAYNKAAELANTHDIARINNRPEYRNADFTHDSPLRRQYYAEHQRALNQRFQEAYDEISGTSVTGRRIVVDERTGSIGIANVNHADGDPEFRFTFDKMGHITGIEVIDNSMAQSFNTDEFLSHFGVKGMHWGVRRESDGGGSSGPSRHQQKKAARQRNRELNRQSRQKDSAEYTKSVDQARERLASGQSHAEYLKARSEYQANKERLGSREARRIVNEAYNRHLEDQEVAAQARDGREAAVGILATVGVLLLAGAAGSRG